MDRLHTVARRHYRPRGDIGQHPSITMTSVSSWHAAGGVSHVRGDLPSIETCASIAFMLVSAARTLRFGARFDVRGRARTCAGLTHPATAPMRIGGAEADEGVPVRDHRLDLKPARCQRRPKFSGGADTRLTPGIVAPGSEVSRFGSAARPPATSWMLIHEPSPTRIGSWTSPAR